MPRVARRAPGGVCDHVINRGVDRMALFGKPAGFEAVEAVVEESRTQRRMRIGGDCVMPNHWSLRAGMLWPRRDGDLAAFMQRLTITDVRRWQERRQVAGRGHVFDPFGPLGGAVRLRASSSTSERSGKSTGSTGRKTPFS